MALPQPIPRLNDACKALKDQIQILQERLEACTAVKEYILLVDEDEVDQEYETWENMVEQKWEEYQLGNFLPLDGPEGDFLPVKGELTNVVTPPKRRKRKSPSRRRGKLTGYNLYARDVAKDNSGLSFGEQGRLAGAAWRALSDEEKEAWKDRAADPELEPNHCCDWVLTRGKSKGELCGRDATHLPSGLKRCRVHIASKARGESGSESGSDTDIEAAPWHDVNIPVVVVGGAGKCQCVLKRGARKGQQCGKPAKGGPNRCKTHVGKD
jgi:hypothetical protein